MTLKQLTYFLKISETGNLTKAAQMLHMSQPPLSYQLKLLEEELGVELFVREAHNMRITTEGSYLVDRANQILALVNKTETEIRQLSSSAEIYINIGTVSSANHYLLPQIVDTFKKRYPKTIFNIYDGNSYRIMELLNNHVIDLGILREPFNRELYDCMKINNTPVLPHDETGDFFVAAGRPVFFPDPSLGEISLKEAVRMPLIVHRRYDELFMHQCEKDNLKPNVICLNDNIITSIEWVLNGVGVGIMPYTSSLLLRNPDIVVQKITPAFYSNLFLVWNSGAKFSKPLMQFIELFNSVS
ncbi:MAG: LysR family transcriptional regulator [Lachnospiraceae bacterium]|nr:LysR family transcriptional regulator [Lachnospiraceae bacterium]